MRRVTQAMRARVEIQGFDDLPDETIRDINYWLRLSPLLCGAWAAAALVTNSSWLVWTLVPVTALGTVMPRHPFDSIYLLFAGPRHGTASIPRYGPPRRFAWALVTAWLAVIGACFETGRHLAGTALGIVLLFIVAVHVTTGFCLASWAYITFRPQATVSPLATSQAPPARTTRRSRRWRRPVSR